MITIGVLFSLITAATAAPATETDSPPSYLCIPELVTGFKPVNDKWVSQHFTRSDKKFLVTKKDDRWILRWHGNKDNGYWKYPVKEEAAAGYVKCESVLGEHFRMSIKNLRFSVASDFGYVDNPNDSEMDNPYMMVGKCTEL
jgi:hypothetical protein